jgi:HPt (histidine-containing phosphotransfer) domain-containing protein
MIDKSKAMLDYQLTEEQYDELLSEFVAQAEGAVVTIEAAAHEGRTKEAADAAHSLKGVAGNLRLDDCFAAARNIECAVKGNDGPAADREISNFKNYLQEVRDAVKKS